MSWADFLLPDLKWQSFTPELVVLLFALLAPLVALKDTDRKGMQQFALVGLGGAFLLTLGSLLGVHADNLFGSGINFTLQYIGSDLYGVFAVTTASQSLKLIFLGTAFLAVLGAGRPLPKRSEEDWGEFLSLILFATLGMMVVASARDLFLLFIAVETASLSSYLLAGFRRDPQGAEASLKYFVIGAISSSLALLGISLLYGLAGSTKFVDMAAALTPDAGVSALAILGVLLTLAGFGFKIGMVPFHTWTPDVYQGSPPPVAGMLAAASKAMGVIAIFQFLLVGLIGLKGDWELLVAVLALASMVVGNIVALHQTNIRRMLAYSSIAQAGYLLIAVAVGTWYAVGGGILHLLVNAFMKLGAFIAVGAILLAGVPDTLDGWKGMAKRSPFVAFAMALFLLSMAGLPPLGGFASKFVLFSSAVQGGVGDRMGWLLVLAAGAVLNSAISLVYYIRLIRTMYVDAPEHTQSIALGVGAKTAVFACAVGVVAVGVWPQPFVDFAMQAAASLLGLS